MNLLLVFLQTHGPVFSHSCAFTGAVLMLVCLGAAFFDYIFYSFVLDHGTELSEVTLIFFLPCIKLFDPVCPKNSLSLKSVSL